MAVGSLALLLVPLGSVVGSPGDTLAELTKNDPEVGITVKVSTVEVLAGRAVLSVQMIGATNPQDQPVPDEET
jgi:hypothetical protein